jgi:hypothetical protein
MKVIAFLAVLAAIDIATSAHAILTRHSSHPAATHATTSAANSPTVMSVGEALGCATSALLLIAILCVVVDARWVARPQERETQQRDTAIKVIDI